ncbi:sulfhydryl oxidase 1 [Galendromus occidentalis]|uniref:Sulfhydryl oxidase n=1 Tax=Galendromus occidentalis TaxID=34638 RepID=A0AAJ6QUI1_9ACAR|nr:sulfhydryl oxidase 1 [Galendromus occidentalis]
MSCSKSIRMLILTTAACATTILAANFGAPLYDTSDPLRLLDHENFHRELRQAPGVYLVQFYNSWCGHCIRFAPTFKKFAADVSAWRPAVRVGVINCADSANGPLCRDNGIEGFPTMKLFWIERGGRGSTNGTSIREREPSGIEDEIVDFIEARTKDKAVLHDFPSLTPSSARSLQDIWDSVPTNLKQVFVVVERPSSYVGRQLILDFNSIKTAAVHRFLRGDGPEELRHQDHVSLLLLEKGVHPRLIAKETDEKKARALFKEKLTELGISFVHDEHHTTQATKAYDLIGDYSKIYLDDIETGILYTLTQEVPLKQEISTKQLSILKSFIQLMYENIDVPPRIRYYLRNVSNRIDVSVPLKGADFLKLLKAAETPEAYLSPEANFIGCKGSDPGKRGYTCSLWTIFHYITVGSHAKFLAKKIEYPNLAVLVIKDYVLNFFSCSECRSHFEKMAANIESELVNANESVLWLWRSHNTVNARLKGDGTEDPARPKIQFPPMSLCPECHNGDKFNESNVLKFLGRFYSEQNLVQSADTRTSPDRIVASTPGAKHFSGFDLTIFLVIYALSITLLFVVFVTMVCRRRKAACKSVLSSTSASSP